MQEWRVFFSEAGLSTPIQKGSWIFAEAKNAYVAVHVVKGATSFEHDKFGRWLICKDQMSPIIIEAARKSDYADYGTFQKTAMAQPLSLEKSILTYKTVAGDELTFYTDQSRLPKTNGITVDLAPHLVFDSPFVRSKWNSGIVTIKHGQTQKTLNFNE